MSRDPPRSRRFYFNGRQFELSFAWLEDGMTWYLTLLEGADMGAVVAYDQAERIKKNTIRAQEYLDAVSLGDGTSAYYAEETSRWYVLSDADVAELVDYLEHDDPEIKRDAYSHWCAGTTPMEMPSGWAPGDPLDAADDDDDDDDDAEDE